MYTKAAENNFSRENIIKTLFISVMITLDSQKKPFYVHIRFFKLGISGATKKTEPGDRLCIRLSNFELKKFWTSKKIF